MKKTLLLLILSLIATSSLLAENKQVHSYKLKELQEKKEKIERWLESKESELSQIENELPKILGEYDETLVTTKQYIESEVAAAINPTDTNNIIISPIRQGYSQSLSLICPVYYTKDFGKTWRESEFITRPMETSFVLGGGDPVFAFDKSGKAYISWIFLYITMDGKWHAGIFWAYSTDGGATWQEESSNAIEATKIEATQLSAIYDKQWMACDLSNSVHANNLYMSVSNLGVGGEVNIECLRKEANKANWENNPTYVAGNNLNGIQFSSIAVDTKGEVHITFYGSDPAASSNPNTIYHSSSTDGGKSFSQKTKITNFTGFFGSHEDITGISEQRSYPSIYVACDQSASPWRDHLYLTWAATGVNSDKGNGMNIYFSKSVDGGSTWSTPKVINKVFGENNDCFHPTITVNPDGVVVVAWYDRTGDLEKNRNTHYHMTYSFDGGETFIESFPVSSEPSDFRYIGNGNNGSGILEYTQIVTTRNYAIPVWADGRTNNGDIDIYVAFVPIGDITSVEEIRPISNSISIESISPNPAKTTIDVSLKSDKKLESLIIYDVSGKVVLIADSGDLRAGNYSIQLDISKLNAGTYFMRIENAGSYAVKKLQVVR